MGAGALSSNSKGLAGRYAGALYDLAVEAGRVDAVLADLTELQALIADNGDLGQLVHSPVFGRGEQQRAITEILGKAGADQLTRQFAGTVAANGRLFALPRIITVFAELVAEKRGQLSAEVISAVALDGERTKAVEQAVAKMAGADSVQLALRVDPSLIGGLVVRIGSQMFDASIKTKLKRLEAAMKGVA